jgi:hypothetical protein
MSLNKLPDTSLIFTYQESNTDDANKITHYLSYKLWTIDHCSKKGKTEREKGKIYRGRKRGIMANVTHNTGGVVIELQKLQHNSVTKSIFLH